MEKQTGDSLAMWENFCSWECRIRTSLSVVTEEMIAARKKAASLVRGNRVILHDFRNIIKKHLNGGKNGE